MRALILALLTISSLALANDWEIIGKTIRCEKDITLEGKVGEKSIHAYMDGEEYILFAEGNYVFMENSPTNLIFDSYNRKRPQNVRLLYRHASTAMPDTSSIHIYLEDKDFACKVQN